MIDKQKREQDEGRNAKDISNHLQRLQGSSSQESNDEADAQDASSTRKGSGKLTVSKKGETKGEKETESSTTTSTTGKGKKTGGSLLMLAESSEAMQAEEAAKENAKGKGKNYKGAVSDQWIESKPAYEPKGDYIKLNPSYEVKGDYTVPPPSQTQSYNSSSGPDNNSWYNNDQGYSYSGDSSWKGYSDKGYKGYSDKDSSSFYGKGYTPKGKGKADVEGTDFYGKGKDSYGKDYKGSNGGKGGGILN